MISVLLIITISQNACHATAVKLGHLTIVVTQKVDNVIVRMNLEVVLVIVVNMVTMTILLANVSILHFIA